MTTAIKIVDLTLIDETTFTRRFADCVILTHDNKILLQQRTAHQSRPGTLVAFGGHIEPGETPLQALVRELHEELGALVAPANTIPLAALSEDFTNHTELIHAWFWHDRADTITGCYEGEAVYYDDVAAALTHSKIMDYLQWLLAECQRLGLLD